MYIEQFHHNSGGDGIVNVVKYLDTLECADVCLFLYHKGLSCYGPHT